MTCFNPDLAIVQQGYELNDQVPNGSPKPGPEVGILLGYLLNFKGNRSILYLLPSFLE